MKTKTFLVFLGISMIIFLGGCDMPDDPLPPIHCPPGELVAPQLGTPYDWSTIDDTTPTLIASYTAITYPYPAPSPAYDCFAQKYHFYLSTAPDYTDELGGISNSGYWTSAPLQPGEMYRWAAAAITEDIEGPMSSYRYFFVGPYCAVSEMVAPPLLEPADGAVVTDLRPTLTWDNPLLCHPTHYWVDLSTNPSFPNVGNGGQSLGPATFFQPYSDLINCETYYWRVKARGSGMGESGPFSETRSFRVQQTGTFCLAPIEIPELIETVPPGPPEFLGIMNANCRSNPWINDNEVGFLPEGGIAILLGLNQDASWGFFKLSNERECWIVMSAVELQPPGSMLDPSLHPVITHDPKPDPTEVPPPASSCSQITDMRKCIANSACVWDQKANACKDK